jgi:hypothetical protein
MTDFLWHKVSEKEKQGIKEQAKFIMDNFSKKLSKIDKNIPESLIESDDIERKEKEFSTCGDFDREIMFENAPDKNEDFIFGEVKKW